LNRHLLEIHAEGRRTVVIIDEAQNLSIDVLEQVRLLTNLETTTQKLLADSSDRPAGTSRHDGQTGIAPTGAADHGPLPFHAPFL
jgi:DNA transposition AAA+ family ATPase